MSGGTVKLTTGQIMELYELNKREQAQGHIYGGGIKPESTKAASDKKIAGKAIPAMQKVVSFTPVRVTYDDVAKITGLLTKEQIRIADGMQNFLSENCSEWGNEVTLELYLYKNFTEKNYFPIYSDSNYTNTSDPDSRRSFDAFKNWGRTKTTVKGANNPLIIHDIFDTFTRHVAEMAAYNAYMISISDAMKWFNYRSKSSVSYSGSVKQSIEKATGKNGRQYFVILMKDICGEVDRSLSAGFINKMTSRAKIAAVGFNLRVAVQQVTSYIRAAAVISPQSLTEALIHMPDIAEMQKYNPIAVLKSWGYFEIDTGRSLREIIVGDRKLSDKIREAAMWLPSKADDLTWATIWNAAKIEVQKINPDLKADSEEFIDAAKKLFSKTIDRTQVVDTVLHRSQMMRNKDSLIGLYTSFMGEANKWYNLLRSASVRAVNEKSPAAMKNLARVSSVFLIGSFATAAAAALLDAFRDDEDEEKDENGNVIGTRTFADKYLKALADNTVSNINPLNLLPFTKEIVSIKEGYSPSRMDLKGIASVMWSAEAWWKYFTGDSKKTAYELMSDAVKAVSTATGIPAGNLLREAEAVYNTIISEVPDDPTLPPSKRFDIAKEKYDINKRDFDGSLNAAVSTAYYNIAFAAQQAGDKATYEAVRRYMITSGRKPSAFDQAMQNREAELLIGNEKKNVPGDPRIQEAAQAEIDKDFYNRYQIIQKLVAEGHKKEAVEQAISEAVRSINQENAPTPEEFVEAYKTGNYDLWHPLYLRLRAAGWSQSDIIALTK